jgi:hypothetical protein
VDRGGIDYCDGGVYKCEDGTHDRRPKCECGEKPF